MISGGNATVYVTDMDAAVRFYSETLGLALTNRFGNHWATLDAGRCYWAEGDAGLTIGLHPVSARHPVAGIAGGVGFGFETCLPLEEVLASFRERGVGITSEIISYEAGKCFAFVTNDGLPTYINEFTPDMLPETDLGSAGVKKTPSRALVGGGHAIVYVANMDAGVRFYSETLGLKLTHRYGDQFATVEAGDFVLAIHPKTPHTPEPGAKGSVALGLQVDEPMARVLSRLGERGVRVAGGVSPPGAEGRVEFEDEDGNAIYLWVPELIAARAARAVTHRL